MVYQVDLALRDYSGRRRPGPQGQPRPNSAIAVGHFLRAWYRNEPRVTVNSMRPTPWFLQHEHIYLAAAHGHSVKIGDMPGIMAADRPQLWRAARGSATPMAFMCIAPLAAMSAAARSGRPTNPGPAQILHQQKGYRAGRSMCVVTYHRERGETGRSTETLG
jgi:hypothetical protein